MTISNKMTIIGLVNGMIGGIILVMPILALKTGWLLIAPITIISGFFSYFSCLLCLRHLKQYNDLDIAIYHHFGRSIKFKIFYDIIIIISMTTLLILYFSLICQQWAGIMGNSKLISISNAIILFPIVYIMKRYDFGAKLLAYGILSIFGYILFLFSITLKTQPGPLTIPAVHAEFIDLAAALAQGFAIQTFFIPILKKNPNRNHYKNVLGITYIIGTIIYCFIGYAGAYSFINRKPIRQPETIIDYFGTGQNWAVIVVQIIYLVHLYSAFPQFLLISKHRFFSIFKWTEPKNVNIKEILYVGITIIICFLIKLIEMKITVIIELNGAIISFFFIYLIPIGLHLKCLYFTKPQQRHIMLNEQKNQDQNQQVEYQKHKKFQYQVQLKQITGQSSSQQERQKKRAQMKQQTQNYLQQDKKQHKNVQQIQINSNKNENNTIRNKCQCDIKFKSKFIEYIQLGAMLIMTLIGLMTMIYTIYLLIEEENNQY